MNDKKVQWTGYMKRRRAFQIALALYIPLIILVATFFENVATACFIAYGALVVVPLGIRHISTACPNCGQPIHFKSFANFLGRRCSHCGIKIGDPIKKD